MATSLSFQKLNANQPAYTGGPERALVNQRSLNASDDEYKKILAAQQRAAVAKRNAAAAAETTNATYDQRVAGMNAGMAQAQAPAQEARTLIDEKINQLPTPTTYVPPTPIRNTALETSTPTPQNPLVPVSSEGVQPINIITSPEQSGSQMTGGQYNPYAGLAQLDELYAPEYEEVGARYDQTAAELEAKRKEIEDANALKAAEQQKAIDAQYAISRQQVERAGQNAIDSAQQNLAFSGFGRSTKAADVIADLGSSTQANLAQLEFQKAQDVATMKANLAQSVEDQLKPYIDKLDDISTEQSDLRKEELKQKGQLMQEIIKNDPMNPMNQLELMTKMADLQIKTNQIQTSTREAVQKEAQGIMDNAIKYGYIPEALSDDQKATLASNLGIPTSKINDIISGAVQKAKNEALKGNINYQVDSDGNVTAIMFDPTTGQFTADSIGQYGKGTETRYQAVTNPITGQVQIFDPITGQFIVGGGSSGGGMPGFNMPAQPGVPGKVVISANNENTPANLKNNCVFFARSIVKDFPKVGVSETDKNVNAQGKRNAINSYAPAAGAVAIMPELGFYGHVGVVESVNADGTITMVEANNPAGTIRRRTGTPAQMKIEGYYVSGGGAKVMPNTQMSTSGTETKNSKNVANNSAGMLPFEVSLAAGNQVDAKVAYAAYLSATGQSGSDAAYSDFTNRYFSAQTKGKSGAAMLTESGDIPLAQRTTLQADPSVKKVKAANDLNATLKAYRDMVAGTQGLVMTGPERAQLDSAYSNLKIAFKTASELGAITAPDVPLIEGAIKPASADFWDLPANAAYNIGGGREGVLASLDTALALSNTRGAQASEELMSLYPEYAGTKYFQSLGIGQNKSSVSPTQSADQYSAYRSQLQPGEILVKDKQGNVGAISQSEFYPSIYTQL